MRWRFVFLLVAWLATSPGQAQQNQNPGKGTQGGDPPVNNTKEEEVESRSGPSGHTCLFAQDGGSDGQPPVDLQDYLGCLEEDPAPLYETTATLGTENGQPLVSYETTLDGGPPPDMCICEKDPDLTFIAVELFGPIVGQTDTPRVAKIRKLDGSIIPQGGVITIYLNTAQYQLTTTPQSSHVNQQILAMLTNAGVQVTDVGDYLVIGLLGPRTPVKFVGFRSTDGAFFQSEVSLEPYNYDNSLYCAPWAQKCGT